MAVSGDPMFCHLCQGAGPPTIGPDLGRAGSPRRGVSVRRRRDGPSRRVVESWWWTREVHNP